MDDNDVTSDATHRLLQLYVCYLDFQHQHFLQSTASKMKPHGLFLNFVDNPASLVF